MSTTHSFLAPRRLKESREQPYQRFLSYCNVIYALMMHDIKNRFFGSGLGQIVMVFWPFTHIMVLIVIYTVAKRPNPYGESIIQYSAVSVYPFILFSYTSRFIVLSAISNKSFLNYPVIQPLDILVARMLLEVITLVVVGILLVVSVAACGFSVMPADPAGAICAVLSTLFLAIGMGFFNAPFAFLIPLWSLVMVLVILLMWFASGVAFVVSNMPDSIRIPLSYNPLLHCIEWFRIAYYNDYPTDVLDRSYVLGCGLVLLTLGLLLNRALRRLY